MITTQIWRKLLTEIIDRGSLISQESTGAVFRGRTSLELMSHRTVIPMTQPVVLSPGRHLGYRFLAAEAAWVLSGDNRLSTIQAYARNLEKFSDDHRTFEGSYGPPFVDQVSWIVRTLAGDVASRQAVLSIWRPRPGSARDVPCTLTLQWLVRDGRMHCVVTMRSSDAWTGWCYDVHTFSAMSAYVLLALRAFDPRAVSVELGDLHLTAGSQHLYIVDRPNAEACASSDERIFDLAPLDLGRFDGPDALVRHLWGVAERDESKLSGRWLRETW